MTSASAETPEQAAPRHAEPAWLVVDATSLRVMAAGPGPLAAMAGRPLSRLLPGLGRGRLRRLADEARAAGATRLARSPLAAAGDDAYVEIEVAPLEGPDGPLLAARLRTGGADRPLASGDVADSLADAVVVVDDAGVVRYANRAAADLLGVGRPEELVGIDFGFPAAPGATTEIDLLRPGAPPVVAEMRVSAAAWDGRPARVAALRDVTERHRAQAEAQRAAMHDPLTGLPGRPLLIDRVRSAIMASGRERPQAAPVLMLMDIDRFSHVDETIGHRQADALLAAVGRRLADRLRASDTVARLGGDEFGVLISALPGPAAAEQAARRLLACLDDPFPAGSRTVQLRGSVGVAIGGGATDAERLLRQAEHAVRAAKAAGGGAFRIYDPGLHMAARRRLRLEADLRQAVADQSFAVRYQPIVEMATGALVDVEALVRWPRRRGALLAPDAFVPLAEQTGLIGAIDLWVLDRACAELADWAHASGGRICVNLSGRGLADAGLAAQVRRVLQARGVAPSSLRLEITESALVRDADGTRRALVALSALGVEVALDDFGTGYSSLARLRRFPIDVLKIDRGFVASDERDIVRTIVSLAEHLGMRVVAEGVETPEQADALRALGCRLGQGWLYAPALDRRQLEPLLAAGAG